mmetsp:Transcript_21234/g.29216  ORF Transcript_21234/g.29216 Transcript_21234/m.29216 type:complete len:115 (-) Transcript_21234:322-666(-)
MSFQFDHWELNSDVFDRFKNDTASLSSTSSSSKKPKKVVQYNEICSVVLIPSRFEYFNAGIDLWYKPADFSTAISQVRQEILLLMSIDKSIVNEESARAALYKPSRGSYFEAEE